VIQLSEHAEGCVLPVRAQPGARRNGIVGEQNGALKVAVTAPPEKGKANDAIQQVLCAALRLKRHQVELISGPASRDKKYLLRDVRIAQIFPQVQALVQNGERGA
jgi:uncharacterized protein (TIGR00251 family)